MQHTSKYQLNLIDPSDAFSPDPLNANATALETQLQAREAAEAALGTRLDGLNTALGSGGNNARVTTGTYVGNGKCGQDTPTALTFDFYPVLVIVSENDVDLACFVRGCTSAVSGGKLTVQWQDKGLSWYGSTVQAQFSFPSKKYFYVAIGY